MSKRDQARQDAAFARGDVGVDGASTDEVRDETEVEQEKAREQFLRGKAYLGREFLTWLLWVTESGDPVLELDGEPVVALMTDRLLLKGLTGEIIELSARGAMAPYSSLVRQSLDRGLLVHQCRLRLTHGERVYAVTIDAEFFDCRSAKLPALMSDDEDDGVQERLFLAEQLSTMVHLLLEKFLRLRASRKWAAQTVPELKAWMHEAPAPRARGG